MKKLKLIEENIAKYVKPYHLKQSTLLGVTQDFEKQLFNYQYPLIAFILSSKYLIWCLHLHLKFQMIFLKPFL